MSSTVERIKERLGISEVISSYIKLEPSGRNLKAKCPFHNEKTPSFFVSPERDTYHCFGCGKGGDIFTFVEDMEGLDFSGALKVLAEKSGVPLASWKSDQNDGRDMLREALERATLHFESNLRGNKEVIDYLRGRGLNDETIRDFRLGYAAPEWRDTYTFLKKSGLSDAQMKDAGIIAESRGRLYDRFRGRVMFPISDPSGRVIAFSGRILPGQAQDGDGVAKYINSPEGALYTKSKVLYAFDKAKGAIRRSDACVIVEGQMDVVLSHQAGVTHTVAASGTALTREQLALIGRLTKNIILAFDADAAGLSAARRSIELALSEGFDVRAAHLPPGEDPGDVAMRDAAAWRDIVEKAQHIVHFHLATLKEANPDTRAFRIAVEKIAVPYVASMKSPMEQAHFAGVIAKETGLPEESVWSVIRKIAAGGMRSDMVVRSGTDIPSSREKRTRKERIEEKILGIVLWQEKSERPFVDVPSLERRYLEAAKESLRDRMSRHNEDEARRLVFEAELSFGDSEHLHEALDELFLNLRREILNTELASAMDEVRRAEEAGDSEAARTKLEACHVLTREINNLTAFKQ